MNKIKKVFKSIFVFGLVFTMLCSSIFPANAVEPRSGGLVSIDYSTPTYSLVSSGYEYVWLTTSWAKASSYTVTQEVTIESSFTTTAGASVSIPGDIETSLASSISYGRSASTKTSISTVIEANSSLNSKLRFKYYMRKYKVNYNVVSTYYDTSTGYYTVTTPYERYAYVPGSSEIYVYYQ